MARDKSEAEACIALLRCRYEEMQRQNTDGYPKRSDFSEQEVVAIKAHLGPWPRALEMAGIKPPRDDDRERRRLEKRISASGLCTEKRKKNT